LRKAFYFCRSERHQSLADILPNTEIAPAISEKTCQRGRKSLQWVRVVDKFPPLIPSMKLSLPRDLRVIRLGAFLILFSLTPVCSGVTDTAASTTSLPSTSRLDPNYGRLPLSFEPNVGQTANEVQFLSRTPQGTVYLTSNEAVLVFREPKKTEAGTRLNRHLHPDFGLTDCRDVSVIRARLADARPQAKAIGQKKLPGIVNYFIGNDPKKWRTRIPTYGGVTYKDIYPGIDLTYYGDGRQLEYDFQLQPGADPNQIGLIIDGSKGVYLDDNGDLIIESVFGNLRQHKPIVYQIIDGQYHNIDGRFVVTGSSTIGFRISSYDRTRELVIDPVISYSSYLGGSADDFGGSIVIDAVGNMHIGGEFSTDFVSGGTIGPGGDGDACVLKMDPSGTILLYCTYIGGTGTEGTLGISIDTAGQTYVAGVTTSTDFPLVSPVQATYGGIEDGFVAILDDSGSSLIFSSYLGGRYADNASGIAVDSAGNVSITGQTLSPDFPTVSALQQSLGGGGYYDCFVTKLGRDGSGILYSTYLGGSGSDLYSAIAVDSSGDAIVTGTTGSPDFPISNAIQPQYGGNGDVFLTKINSAGSAFIFSTFLGGSGGEGFSHVTVDSSDLIYVTGLTESTDFPVFNALQPFYNGSDDGFVTKLTSDGSSYVYSTYLGGMVGGGDGPGDYPSAICVDAAGDAVITGQTYDVDFPIVSPIQSSLSGNYDAFVSMLKADGSALLFSTYLGGADTGGQFVHNDEFGGAVAIAGNVIYVTGATDSLDFPTVQPLQNSFAGGEDDAFITRISIADLGTGGLSVHSLSPLSSSVILASPSDAVDDPLKVVPDEAHLKNQQIVSNGLVADGVTPLLIEFDPNPIPTTPTTYTISTANIPISGGTVKRQRDLSLYQYVLQTVTPPQFVQGHSVTLSTEHPTGFAYISGVKSEDIQFDPGYKELTVTLQITKSGDTSPIATTLFRVRKPPVVLVHGYNSDNGAWYTDETLMTPNGFLTQLEGTYPADFVLPVEYGVDRSSTKPDDAANISGKFIELAPLLDQQLISQVENPQSLWHTNWAFTRYDIVGHSQGGLLARMLCTDRQPPSFNSFRSQSNAWRGRFHRVVTLNSPHNGSTLLRYLLDMQNQGHLVPQLLEVYGELLQPKFDPWGSEIPEINGGDWHVDPTSKFHLVGTEIDNGTTKLKLLFVPLCYSQTGITVIASGQNVSRGKIVIPLGSDGVVDYASQFGGSISGDLQGTNIAHSPPTWAFGVAVGDTVTANVALGSYVAGLLAGPDASFGPFVLQPIDPLLKGKIDAVVPPVNVNGSLIQLLFAQPTNGRNFNASTTQYQYTIAPAEGQDPASPPSWYCELIGPGGVTTDGVKVTPNRTNSNQVTVTVDNSVVGDAVLYVNYNDVNGNVITGAPVIVLSHPPSGNLTGVELVPGNASLTVGSTVSTQVWGNYDTGVGSQLYVPTGADITYISENPTIATVDAFGNIQMLAVGSTNIDVSYLGFAAQTAVTVTAPPPPPVLSPLGAVSRKVHKTAGTFDLSLPLSGDEAIECRSGGLAGRYQIIVTFASPVTVGGASINSGTGTVSGFTVNNSQVTVNLAGVTSAQRLVVTLSSVSDGMLINDVSIPMAILVGDTTADGIVNKADLTATRDVISQPVNIVDFRDDMTVDGQIDKRDVNLVRSNLGMQLPP